MIQLRGRSTYVGRISTKRSILVVRFPDASVNCGGDAEGDSHHGADDDECNQQLDGQSLLLAQG